MINRETEEDHKVNLEKVFELLTIKPMFRSQKDQDTFNVFTTLLASKSSFAHRVHKAFNQILEDKDNPLSSN